MPIPEPKQDEEKDKYIERCMADDAMQEYDQKQRSAVCNNQFNKANKDYVMDDVTDLIIYKDTKQGIITAPVLVPDTPDCDCARGEKLLTPDEIADMAYSYMANYRVVDKLHDYFKTEHNVAYPVASWLLEQPTTYKNIRGQDVILPVGTWMATVKVTDNETLRRVESGEYQGFSVTAIERNQAEQIASIKERVLIKDIKDPVAYTISIVPEPCVYEAVFCSVKTASEKVGRRFSNSTLDKINKVFLNLKTGFEEIQNIISQAENERKTAQTIELSKKEVISMVDEDEKTITLDTIKKEFNEMLKPLHDEIEALKEAQKEKPEFEIPKELKEQLDGYGESIKAIEDKIGEPTPGNGIEGQVDKDQADKKVEDTYTIQGRDALGRAIPKP